MLTYFFLEEKNLTNFIAELSKGIKDVCSNILATVQEKIGPMKKVYQIIFNQEKISKKSMLDPNEKQRKLLEQNNEIFKQEFKIDVQNLFTFCKYFKVVKYIIEELSYLNVDEV